DRVAAQDRVFVRILADSERHELSRAKLERFGRIEREPVANHTVGERRDLCHPSVVDVSGHGCYLTRMFGCRRALLSGLVLVALPPCKQKGAASNVPPPIGIPSADDPMRIAGAHSRAEHAPVGQMDETAGLPAGHPSPSPSPSIDP